MPSGPTPDIHSHAATRERLVMAAVPEFATRGYEGTSARDVERRSGVNRGLVAYHFGSKDRLWQASVEWLMDRFHEEMTAYRDVLRMVSPDEREKLLLKIYTRFVAKNPDFVRILMMEGIVESERSRWIARRLRETLDFFDEVTGRKDDFATPEQAAVSYYLFVGAASMLFTVPAQCESLFGFTPHAGMLDDFADLVAELGFDIRHHPRFGVAATPSS